MRILMGIWVSEKVNGKRLGLKWNTVENKEMRSGEWRLVCRMEMVPWTDMTTDMSTDIVAMDRCIRCCMWVWGRKLWAATNETDHL